jgi:hypothetical protein
VEGRLLEPIYVEVLRGTMAHQQSKLLDPDPPRPDPGHAASPAQHSKRGKASGSRDQQWPSDGQQWRASTVVWRGA